MIIWKSFKFDAAHYVTGVPSSHKCSNMHGHTFNIAVFLEGDPSVDSGWIVDFGEIKEVVSPLVETMDHSVLNEIPGLENPTCENICIWLWNRLVGELPGLCKVSVSESPSSGCEYTGP